MTEQHLEEMTNHLELIKSDLRWQLSFEEIDWDHFSEFVKSAKVLRDKIEELKSQGLENEEKETLAEINRRQMMIGSKTD